ncbi:hypothetical protein ATANTOWER_031659 [Ataeniobius toweri]|uniref:BED-type domain-containing protein n=1 Tax=Ataeniobius toweri TaxID=208326 RepID=A0ABU7B1H1_9TELE|nr:hypothetical protein [Ataeniobius toweri]
MAQAPVHIPVLHVLYVTNSSRFCIFGVFVDHSIMEQPSRKRSQVWEYFDLVPPNKVQCLLCPQLLTYNNTSSMLRHYREKHENIQPRATNQGYRKQELDEALVDFIVKDSQPFSVSKPKPLSQTFPCHTSLLCSL